MKKETEISLLNKTEVAYDKDSLVGNIVFCLKRTVYDTLAVGEMLLTLKDKEKGSFCNIVEQEVGISVSRAYRYMTRFKKFAKYSNIPLDGLTETVIDEIFSLPDEDLKTLEETGNIEGYTMDDIAQMSGIEAKKALRQVKAKNEKLETEKEKLVSEAVKEKTQEQQAIIDMLKDENKELKKQLPENLESTRYLEAIENIHSLAQELFRAVNSIKFDADLSEDVVTQGKVEFHIRNIGTIAQMLETKWDKFQETEEFGD